MWQELTLATIQALGTLASVGLAAHFVVKQIKFGERLKLKLEIYKEILKVAQSATDAYGALQHQVHMFMYGFISIWLNKQKYQGFNPNPPTDAVSMINLNAEAGIKASEVLGLIESWTVIDPRIRVFHDAINVAVHDMRNAWNEVEPYIFRSTAMFALAPNPTRRHPAHKEDWKGFEAAMSNYNDTILLLDCYVADLKTEMQNELLGELFKAKSPTRVPIDPKYKAITLKDADFWHNHFVNNTAWGAYGRQLDEDNVKKVLAKLAPNAESA